MTNHNLACAHYIADFAALLKTNLPTPTTHAPLPQVDAWPKRVNGKRVALILSPHPDDESLTGALPLRLKEQGDWQIINLAITLGSKPERKKPRLQELANACAVLGFDLLLPAAEGFSLVTPETRDQSEKIWRSMVDRVVEILNHYRPDMLMLPNIRDGHRTHTGTYYLGMDALALMPKDFACHLVQSEFWHPNALPNLMIGLTHGDATALLTALSCHAGEVARNPYHQRFPAYLSDNVRRGSERVGGERADTAAFDFAMLYQIDRWQNGRISSVTEQRIVSPDEKINLA